MSAYASDALLLSFYGDDITGSTDAMDALARSGIETVLFLDPPDPETVAAEFPEARAIGIAGRSRSMTPTEMDDELTRAFSALEALDTPLVHYKICSTFDSAPDVGSIGRAIDIGADVFETNPVPVVPAAPPLGRYVVFGNMFAADIDDVYRLDRHPTMSDHPVTPMDESDLRRHLGKQTDRSMELVDVRALKDGVKTAVERFDEAVIDGPGVIFFDTLTEDDARTVGSVIWTRYVRRRLSRTDGNIESESDDTAKAALSRNTDGPPSFVVGSSGFQYAMADYWESAGIISASPAFDPLPAVDQLVVMSGSASPLTATQIDAAMAAGFADIHINTAALVDSSTADDERERIISVTLDALDSGDSVVIYAAHGPADEAIEATVRRAETVADPPEDVGRYIAKQQGELLRTILDDADVDRVVVAGGDTCGRVIPMLDIYALQTRFPLAPGTPMCRACADTRRFDGLEIALNGGQLGDEQYFVRARDGAADW